MHEVGAGWKVASDVTCHDRAPFTEIIRAHTYRYTWPLGGHMILSFGLPLSLLLVQSSR